MREVSNDTLTLAMKTAGDDVKDKNFQEYFQSCGRDDQGGFGGDGAGAAFRRRKAQGEIIKIVRKMEEEGKIVLVDAVERICLSNIIKSSKADILLLVNISSSRFGMH
jgi:hypothetical protein